MKFVDMKCPNCGGNLSQENNSYVCNSCGTSFSIDYDDSDVEYERLKGEAEREEKQRAHEKELLEKKFELEQKAQIASEQRQLERQRQEKRAKTINTWVKRLIVLAILAAFVFGCYKLYQYMKDNMGYGSYSSYNEPTATPTPAPDYNVKPEDLTDSMKDFVETGKTVQMKIDQCSVRNENGIPHFYDKTDAVYYEAYLVSDIPEVNEKESCRLVIIYEVTWENETDGEKTCYDAVYFDGIKVNPNGGVITDFGGKTIWRSDAAWGWGMAYSFEEYDQCYRENITALGGKVTKIDYTYGG